MDSIKLGLITVCCIISVKLTDWPSVVWNITGVWPFWLVPPVVGASLLESDIDRLFILFVSKSDWKVSDIGSTQCWASSFCTNFCCCWHYAYIVYLTVYR
jgi:hypothetical protein